MRTESPKNAASEGFNQWTVPWEAPAGAEIDAINAGTFSPAHFDISATDIETYQRDGVVFLPGAFTDWVDKLRAGLARNVADPSAYRFPAESTGSEEPGRFFDSYCNWTLIPEYTDFVFYSGAASLAGQAMQSGTAQFFHEHAFMKKAGTQHATPWHQDIPYYCVSGEQSVSIYIALDEVEQAQAVQYIRGSHRWNETYYPTVWLDESEFNVGTEGYTGSVPDVEANRDQYDIASWPLSAGDTILFSFKTLHGTTDAKMSRGRSAFSTRWMGDDIRYCQRDGITSPPYENMGTRDGDRMREDWFPVVWRK